MAYNFATMNNTLDNKQYDEDYKDYRDFEIVNKISFGLKCAIGIWIVLVNLFFLLALSLSKRIQKKYSYWLLKNLAVADLLVGLLVVPIAIHNDVYERWILGDMICRVWIMADVVLCSVSLLALLTINIGMCSVSLLALPTINICMCSVSLLALRPNIGMCSVSLLALLTINIGMGSVFLLAISSCHHQYRYVFCLLIGSPHYQYRYIF